MLQLRSDKCPDPPPLVRSVLNPSSSPHQAKKLLIAFKGMNLALSITTFIQSKAAVPVDIS